MKTKTKKQFGWMVALALVLGMTPFAASAAEGMPQRPDRPGNSNGKGPNATELKQIIKDFQTQKKEFLAQQKEQKADTRSELRELGSVGSAMQEAKESIAEAKRISREQARKLVEEAKEAAKEGRKRD